MCTSLKKMNSWSRTCPIIAGWETLRSVGRSYAVRLTIFVPVVGYFIIFNDKLAQYSKLIREFVADPSATVVLSVSPRLFQVYIGLWLIGVASAIYSVLCPVEVNYYGSSAVYAMRDGKSFGDFKMEQLEDKLRRSAFVDRHRRIRDRYERNGILITTEQKSQVDNGILHLYFEYLNTSYWFARILATILILLGFIALFMSSFGIFIRVISILRQAGLTTIISW